MTESIDVDALERRFKACDHNYNYHKVEEIVRDMLTALRQKQEENAGLAEHLHGFTSVGEMAYVDELQAEIARLQAELKTLVHSVVEEFMEADQEDSSVSYWQDRFFGFVNEDDEND